MFKISVMNRCLCEILVLNKWLMMNLCTSKIKDLDWKSLNLKNNIIFTVISMLYVCTRDVNYQNVKNDNYISREKIT